MNALTQLQRDRFTELDAVVQAGGRTFHAVGKALIEICRKKLYREDHASWEAYCEARGFQMSGRHAYRLVAWEEVKEDLRPIGQGLPNESQARAMVRLSPDGRRQVWQEAVQSQVPVTAQRLEILTARALAALPPEEQAERVQDSEQRIMGGRARQVGGEDRAGRLAQIGRLAKRLRKLTEGLGGDGEEALTWLDGYDAAIGKVAA